MVSNPQLYEVTITTTFVVPDNERSVGALRIWHALPTARPWDGLDSQMGASAITYQPDSGRIQYLGTSDSQSVFWELREGLEIGKTIEFVSRFRVRSADRTFDFRRSTAKKSDNQHKRPQVRSVDRTLMFKQSNDNRSDYKRKRLYAITPPNDVDLDSIVYKITKSRPPEVVALEFCKWVTENIKYDASVPYGPSDLFSILKYKRGHCGHQMATFQAMCMRAGIPTRTVRGLNLDAPGGIGPLDKIRRDFENSHTWAQVYFPDSGWVEIDPGQGVNGYSLQAQLIQNNSDFQNYVVLIYENGTWKRPDWENRDGKWFSPYGIENHRAFRRVEAN